MVTSAVPLLRYTDPVAAADWVGDTFGLSLVREDRDAADAVVRIWLQSEDALVVIEGSPIATTSASPSALTMVGVREPESIHRRLEGSPARVGPLAVDDEGTVAFEVTDPWGHTWRASSADPWDVL